jgi:hypothetical protein
MRRAPEGARAKLRQSGLGTRERALFSPPVARAQAPTDLIAELIPPSRRDGARFDGRYQVEFRGEIIVARSRDPELDACRVLLGRGLRGRLTFIDADTGKSRIAVDIGRGARLTSEEGPNGPRFAKYRETRVARSLRPEAGQAYPRYRGAA